MIAAGIGITPYISYLRDLDYLSASYELHYLVSNADELLFVDELKYQLKSNLHVYNKGKNNRFDLKMILENCQHDEHIYICGPERLIVDARKYMAEVNLSENNVHYEMFKTSLQNKKFQAELYLSEKIIDVDVNETLLEALERNNVETNYYCRSGACGECKTKVLAGKVEHRDFFLSQKERDNNTYICLLYTSDAADE